MPVFHAPSRRASGNERGARALQRLCERVGAFRTRSLVVGEDFEDVERELHAQGRVAAGSYPPAAPTDPGVPNSGTRLLR